MRVIEENSGTKTARGRGFHDTAKSFKSRLIKLSQHFLTIWVSSDVATMQVRITNPKPTEKNL